MPRAHQPIDSYASPGATPTDRNNGQSPTAIIGGGIAAACIAYQLLQRGDAVTLYCRDADAGLGASGNRQGALYPLLNGQHDELSQIYAQAFGFARRQYDTLAQSLEFAHNWCGVLSLDFNDKQQQKNAQIAAGPFEPNFVTALDRHQSDTRANIKLGRPGLLYPQGGWLCPRQLCQALFAWISAHPQGQVHYQNHVQQLTQTAKGWRLYGNTGSDDPIDVIHPVVVLANGYQVTNFAQTQAMPLYPVRGQVTHVSTDPDLALLRTVLCADGYLTPQDLNHHSHCLGASYGRNQTDLAIRPEEQQQNKDKLCASLPQCAPLQNIDCDHSDARVGIRCASRDHLPVMGIVADYARNITNYQRAKAEQRNLDQIPLTYHHNLFVLGGLGARGLCSAPLLAEALASQIHNEPLPLSASQLRALHPGRFWLRRLQKGKELPSVSIGSAP